MSFLKSISTGMTESDVEQLFITPLLMSPVPVGLGFKDTDFRTKGDIRKIAIDKGRNKKLYYPDYAIICDGLPLMIIEAKAPNEDLEEAIREARLYASELNAYYPRGVNPCQKVVATDGLKILAGYWDDSINYIEISPEELTAAHPSFDNFMQFAAHSSIKKSAKDILRSIRTDARYFKPVHMLGGKSVANELIGDNSFGTNVSIEYKYLFNPESLEDRASVVRNAYVVSKRKQAHVAPIDRLIRSALPRQIVDAHKIDDTSSASNLIEAIQHYGKDESQICLLVGSVGSGKSTFTDYLHHKALPSTVMRATQWINLNLNQAPLSRELIYDWVISSALKAIASAHVEIDLEDLSVLKKIYSKQLAALDKGKASLFSRDSDRYAEIVFAELDRLQADKIATFSGVIDLVYKKNHQLLVIVLDNCDKRGRDDQLLMFEVASWLKNNFSCIVFLPLRDTTYDQYRNEPPLDTVIKDLVFRIDPPLLDRVIQARLNFALREISTQKAKFTYMLSNGMRVECNRSEVASYLKTITASLFQDQLFKRIVSGLAGRNIRKGLEILLDFCKSGYITADEILKVRTNGGDHQLPKHTVAKILLKGRRKYYGDSDATIKNLFSSYGEDDLPDPFIRISILQWLKNRWRIPGPNSTLGFHQARSLFLDLQALGHSELRVQTELEFLVKSGCIFSESNGNVVEPEDLVCISPGGHVHLDLLRDVNYLAAVSEDVFFRENQTPKQIAENIVGRGQFRADSRATSIANSNLLLEYLVDYQEKFFPGMVQAVAPERLDDMLDLLELRDCVRQVKSNDHQTRHFETMASAYPIGSKMEAQVVSIQQYGFFIEFGLNGKGLVHKSNYGHAKQAFLDQLETGDWVMVELQNYSSEKMRFGARLIGPAAGNQFEMAGK